MRTSERRDRARRSTAAHGARRDVHVLVAGKNAGAAAEAAAKLAGVGKVLVADAPHFEHMLAERWRALVASLAGRYDAIVAPATTTGKNIMPRVAALLDVMQISRHHRGRRRPTPSSARSTPATPSQTVQSTDAKKVITVRTTAFQPARRGRQRPRSRRAAAAADPGVSTFEGEEIAKSDRPGADLGARSSSRAAARSARPRTSRRASSRSPTSSAPRSAPAAPRSTPATRRTTTRSARPARSSRPSSTSRSASPARSSTSPA